MPQKIILKQDFQIMPKIMQLGQLNGVIILLIKDHTMDGNTHQMVQYQELMVEQI